MKTINQIKDGQAINLGYNSFRDLFIKTKGNQHDLNLCVARSCVEFANQALDTAVGIVNQNLSKETTIEVILEEKINLEFVIKNSKIIPHETN